MANLAIPASKELSNCVLTWQGQGYTDKRIESTGPLSIEARRARSFSLSRPGTLANFLGSVR